MHLPSRSWLPPRTSEIQLINSHYRVSCVLTARFFLGLRDHYSRSLKRRRLPSPLSPTIVEEEESQTTQDFISLQFAEFATPLIRSELNAPDDEPEFTSDPVAQEMEFRIPKREGCEDHERQGCPMQDAIDSSSHQV